MSSSKTTTDERRDWDHLSLDELDADICAHCHYPFSECLCEAEEMPENYCEEEAAPTEIESFDEIKSFNEWLINANRLFDKIINSATAR